MMRIPTPHSLRTRLIWLLFVAIFLTASVQALIAYRTAHTEADAMFDYHMQQMAMSLRSGLPFNGVDNASRGTSDDGDLDLMVQVWTAEGLRVFQSTSRAPLPDRAILGFSNLKANGTTYRVFSIQSKSQTVQVAQDMAIRRAMAGGLALRSVVPIAVMAPLLMLVVWWAVSASLAPVDRVRRQVAMRHADELTEVSTAGLPDEIQPLVNELNLLFGRVQQAFEAQKSFVADAAHELRSPLAALKLQAQGLKRASDEATRGVAVDRLNAGIDRATRLIEQLLVLARQQASTAIGSSKKSVQLSDIARRGIEDMASTAKERQIDIGLIEAQAGKVVGDPQALDILVRNLLGNAIKYTPPHGTVDLAVTRVDDRLILTLDDSGPGIPESDRQRVLDRFYRVAGTQESGSGLGLAIVKSIADLHNASLLLETSGRLGGLRVQVSFPGAHE
jgi:two-component system OmpR family sensor kinase